MATTRLHPDAPAEALLNRELSWLDLNGRVLELAADPNEPLLERVKFCSIFSSNLDEFFMVRVAGLLDQVVSGLSVSSRDGRTSQQTLDEIRARVLELTGQQTQLWRDQLCPALAAENVLIGTVDQMVDDLQARRERWDFSYCGISEPYLDAFAPVVARLAGR